jgi:hypothetical protein
MKLRTGLLALVATGGAAALVFGGTAASTAFSQDASGSITANAATVSMTTSNMTTTLSGLAPGGSASTTLYVKNTSTTPAAFYLTNVGFTPTKAGSSGNNPTSNLITVTVTDTVPSGSGTATYPILTDVPLNNLIGQNTLLTPSSLITSGTGTPPNQLQTLTVTFTLAQNAGNNWNGAQAKVPFTVHLQDISGTDASGFVATHN